MKRRTILTPTFLTLTAIALWIVPTSLPAHGGRLDKNGCHTNRKTGQYHCHGGALAPAPSPSQAPARQQSRATPAPQSLLSSPDSPGTLTDPTLIRTAQVLLLSLGYEITSTGRMDSATISAVAAFRRNNRLPDDEGLTAALLLRIAREAAAACGR